MVEFALLVVFLATITMAAIELGRYLSLQLRLSSAAREAGRLIIANGLTPRDGTAVDYSKLETDIDGLVFTYVKQMIEPSFFNKPDGYTPPRSGIMYVSLLKRIDDGSSSAPDKVKIQVERVFQYGSWDAVAYKTKPLPMYAAGKVLDGDDADGIIDPLSLNVGERTVLIELNHPLTFTNSVRNLLNVTAANWNRIYEYAVF